MLSGGRIHERGSHSSSSSTRASITDKQRRPAPALQFPQNEQSKDHGRLNLCTVNGANKWLNNCFSCWVGGVWSQLQVWGITLPVKTSTRGEGSNKLLARDLLKSLIASRIFQVHTVLD